MKGIAIVDAAPKSVVARLGETAAPTLLSTDVIPPAAERSSGSTTAITYDCLVGTSIWLILNRNISIRMASCTLGIRGTRIDHKGQ